MSDEEVVDEDIEVGTVLTEEDDGSTLVGMKKTSSVSKPRRKEEPISLRLPVGSAERVQKLVEEMSRMPAYEGWAVTPHGVMRLAIVQGLGLLEGQVKEQAKKKAGGIL